MATAPLGPRMDTLDRRRSAHGTRPAHLNCAPAARPAGPGDRRRSEGDEARRAPVAEAQQGEHPPADRGRLRGIRPGGLNRPYPASAATPPGGSESGIAHEMLRSPPTTTRG